ncbi:MAG TPA: zinc ribbon domain-containing protein [Phycisphaerae bacterium]|nr:zinc ribbon domain-containing protein [Phycisphaerae bacterium]
MSETPNTPPSPEPTPNPAPIPEPVPSPVVNSTVSAATSTPVSAAVPVAGEADPADVEKNKVFALLSYIGILWLVPLLAAKDSPFAKYHANQGILLSIVAIGGGIALGIVFFIIAHIPILNICGGCVGCVVQLGFFVAVLAFAIIGILNAVNGKMKPLPLFPAVTLVK